MKIMDTRKNGGCTFDELKEGTVFCYGGDYYLALDDFEKAARLEDGALILFGGLEKVVPINCELVIKD